MNKIIRLISSRGKPVDGEQFNLVCSIIKKGGVVALPTDTIYGLAARVDDTSALNKIYEIKGRDLSKPLSICVATHDEIDDIASTDHLPKRLLLSLLPGPVTILLKRKAKLNKDCNPGIETVGIRIPNHEFIMEVSKECGPLALTSANRSGDTSPILVKEFEDLWPELDLVCDGGQLHDYINEAGDFRTQRLGSTVVDLTQEKFYTIIRKGYAVTTVTSILTRFGYRKSRDAG